MSGRLLLFAKAPGPGRAKTRLAPVLGEAGAARFYEALLDDTVRRLRNVDARLELHVAPGGDGAGWFRSRYPEIPVRLQRGEGLGARLKGAFGRSFDRGDRAAMAVGSDHPTLPAEYLNRGFEALAERDLVLGPGRDGGYYAVGIRRAAWPAASEIFRGVPWSTARVTAVTRAAAEAAGLSLEELPRWYDVDRPADLSLLRRDASPDSRSLRALERLEERRPPSDPEDRGGGFEW